MAIVLNGVRNIVENFNRLSARTLPTTDDRQTTDRQTDWRTHDDIIANVHVHSYDVNKRNKSELKHTLK